MDGIEKLHLTNCYMSEIILSKLIGDYALVEISNKVKDILRIYHKSSWHSEPNPQNLNPSELPLEPSRHGPTPSSTSLEHLLPVYCLA